MTTVIEQNGVPGERYRHVIGLIVGTCISLLVACDRGSSGGQYTTTFPHQGLACDESAARNAEQWLSSWIAWRGEGPLLGDLDVPTLDSPRLQEEPRVTISIGRDGLTADGAPASPDELDEIIDAADSTRAREGALLKRSLPLTIGVAVAAEVTWSRVREVLLQVPRANDGTELQFLLRPAPLPATVEPPPPELLARTANVSHENPSPPHAAKLLHDVVGTCRPMAELFQRLATAPPERRDSLLKRTLIDAWIECKCAADLGVILAFVHDISNPSDPPLSAITLRVAADGTPLEFHGTWGEAAPRLLSSSGGTVCLRGVAESAPATGWACAD